MVVGGGDSAVETALLLKDQNEVILSYRSDKFSRLKPKNKEKITEAIEDGTVEVLFNSNLQSIKEDHVLVKINENDQIKKIANDLIYIFAGGELPTAFLQKAGVQITKRFGQIVKKHR
jgi:thioredoxin reductase